MPKKGSYKKKGCGCNAPFGKKSFRLWGGKHRRSTNRRKRRTSRSTKRGGYTNGPTYPFPGVSEGNTIPLSGGVGSSCDPTTVANVEDARLVNL